MKAQKILKIISIICCAIGFLIATNGLIAGLSSINANGLAQIGVIFIFPSIFALIIILLDFLISNDTIKKGLIYSCISTLIKFGAIVLLIPSALYSLQQSLRGNLSNLDFYMAIFIFIIITIIPSVLNVIKFIKKSKE